MEFQVKTMLVVYPSLAILALISMLLSKMKNKKLALHFTSVTWLIVALLFITVWMPLINLNVGSSRAIDNAVRWDVYEIIEIMLGVLTGISCIGYYFTVKDWPKFMLMTICALFGICLICMSMILLPMIPHLFDIIEQVGLVKISIMAVLFVSPMIFVVSMFIALINIDRWIIKYRNQI